MSNRVFLITILILFLHCPLYINGQSISISSFQEIQNDITAVSHGTMVIDQNGEKCALIKIETTQTGFSFDVGSLGIVKTDYKPGEIWVYVPHGVKRINISHRSFGVLRDYNFPHALNSGRTYLLTLITKNSNQPISPKRHNINSKLSRTILFQLQKNEILYNNEQYMDMTIDGSRFCCMIEDTITKKKTLVWNGERKLSALKIRVSHIDLNDYDKCIMTFSDILRRVQNIKIEDQYFGPYDDILYLADPEHYWVYNKGPFMEGLDRNYRIGWRYKNMFAFCVMGNNYLNINGKITPIPYKYLDYENGEYSFNTEKFYHDIDTLGFSPNGKYSLKFKGDKLIGNTKFSFPLPYTPTFRKKVHVYDNGKAIIIICNDQYDWHYYLADLNTGTLRELLDDECFDFKNGYIIKNPINWNRQFERKDSKIEWDVEIHSICLQDPSLQHSLISRLNIPYVLLDNQAIGKAAAFDACYNAYKKSFLWIAYEDNALVLYEYAL